MPEHPIRVPQFSQFRHRLHHQICQSAPQEQVGTLSIVRAKTYEEFKVNFLRNEIGSVIHGKNQETKHFFKQVHESFETPLLQKMSSQNSQISSGPVVTPVPVEFKSSVDEGIHNIQKAFRSFQSENSPNEFKSILRSLKQYCLSIIYPKDKKDPIKKSAEFLNQLKSILPEKSKEKGLQALQEMIHCGAHLVNGLDTPAAERKNFLNSYLQAVEIFVQSIFEELGENVEKEEIEIFKNVIFIAVSNAGLLFTYERRSFVDKTYVRIKQAFVPLAYFIGSLSGTAIGHYLTSSVILTGLQGLGVSAALCSFLPPVILGIVGFVSGYAITKIIEYGLEKIFEKAVRNINDQIEEVIEQRRNLTGFRGKNNSFQRRTDRKLEHNKHQNWEHRSKAKDIVFYGSDLEIESLLKGNSQIENKNQELQNKLHLIEQKMSLYRVEVGSVIKRISNTFFGGCHNSIKEQLQNEILSMLHVLIPQERDLNELLFLFHNLINCSENHSEEKLKQEYDRVIEILNEKIPLKMSREEKHLIYESMFVLVFKARSLSTAAMRNSFLIVYWLTDLAIDELGIGATELTDQLFTGLSGFAGLSAEFGSNFISGLFPLSLGILIYISIQTASVLRDKNEVNVPNPLIIPSIYEYIENESKRIDWSLELNEGLKNYSKNRINDEPTEDNFSQKISGNVQEIFHSLESIQQGHFKNSQCTGFLVYRVVAKTDDHYTVDWQLVDSLTLRPKSYLSYPLTSICEEILCDEKSRLLGELNLLKDFMPKKWNEPSSNLAIPHNYGLVIA